VNERQPQRVGLGQICELFGVSRQAYYKYQKATLKQFLEEQLIVSEVKKIRRSQARVGTRKLQKMLRKLGIEVGRDTLFNILRAKEMLVRPRKKYVRTTNSWHRFHKYPNLIKELEIVEPNQVWVADLTYIETLAGFCYLALITDVYSRKIIGYDLSRNLTIEGSQRALRMALKNIPHPQRPIHHSDRGLQYCSAGYVEILTRNGIRISMTEESHVYENALAERVNGILKSEFMLGETLRSFEVAKELVCESIKIYNEQRLHISLNYETPAYRYAA
jgi:transposase InsO family protein